MCENSQGFFWTPGGGVEAGEGLEQTLARELQEELAAELVSAEAYLTIHDEKENEEVTYFLIDMTLPKSLPENIEICWYGVDAHTKGAPQISRRVYSQVFPRLVDDGLLD